MTDKLQEILELPFEQYMTACWDHARQIAKESRAGEIVFSYLIQDPSEMEAGWARRYWFAKNNAYEFE